MWNKQRKRLCKWIASFLTVALLVNQSCFSVLAEEYDNYEYIENVADTVTNEDAENSDASDEVGTDTDKDTDANTNAESDIESDTESDMDADENEITTHQYDAEESIIEEDSIEFNMENSISMASVGDTFVYNNLKYKIINDDVDNLQVEVMGYVNGKYPIETIDIPSTVSNGTDEYTVVHIGEKAFYDCSNLTSITIPDSVTSIKIEAFRYCSNLTSFTIPDSVTSIEDGAFWGCSRLTSIAIPDKVTNIKALVFADCRSLTSITIPNSVITIGNDAFWKCSSLTSITIPDSVTSIEDDAFAECLRLTSITIPDKVTNIGKSAFYSCSSLNNITIPNSVTYIGSGAFQDCRSLTSIIIPDSITTINGLTFSGCSSLNNITIPDSVTYISSAFVDCVSLTSITIPDSVISISGTFKGCSSLINITIPDSVTYIGRSTFDSCSSLTTVTIPDSVINIDKYAFIDCNSLTSVIILNDYVKIENYAFENCPYLNSLQIALHENITVTPTIIDGIFVFKDCPTNRSLTFLTKDGTTELSNSTTPTLAEAVKVYNAVDDGGINDGYWYGWKLPEVSSVTSYPVTIKINKDDRTWLGCTKEFALSSDNGISFITDLNNVPNGTYSIYDITNNASRDGFINTGFTIEVKNASAKATIDYYTVTFYNDNAVFDEQIILCNTMISTPSSSPTKDGHTFYIWVISKGNSIGFNFNNPITSKTDIYASWIADLEETFTITVSSGTGGSVTPSGEVKVKYGDSQQFTITPKDGYRISSILADGNEVLNSEQVTYYSETESTDAGNTKAGSRTEYYVFENVIDNHTLAAYFEPTNTGDNNTPDDTDGNNGSDDSDDNDTVNNNIPDASGSNDTSDNNGSGGSGSNNTDNDSAPVNISDTTVISNTDIISTNTTAPAPKDNEPKTGYNSHIEVYATIAMIAGLSYLLLYFADGKNGMTENEKKEIIASLVKWAQKGKRLRRFAALAVIFLILVYYHSIGKRTAVDWKALEWKAVYEK